MNISSDTAEIESRLKKNLANGRQHLLICQADLADSQKGPAEKLKALEAQVAQLTEQKATLEKAAD